MGKTGISVERQYWGEADGRSVWLFCLEGKEIAVRVSNYGGVIQALTLKDPDGHSTDVVLGYDDLDGYRCGDAFFGAMIGPIADRTAQGRCTLDGREVRLPQNAGRDSMHCGGAGFHCRVFDWELSEDGLRLFRTFADGELGLPGELSAAICFRLTGPRTLRLEYTARCTRETAVSFTNHSYFNLTGAWGDCRSHVLTVRADRYAETSCTDEPVCTGRLLPVAGTPLDLRRGAAVGEIVDRADFGEIAAAGGLDHYFRVAGEGMREVARLRSPETGLTLLCRSDAPGLLVYAGNGLSHEPGKGGVVYERNWGVCLETERFPNAVNDPLRRAEVLLEPGETYASATEFGFEWKK